jgi:GTPase Era involved in 16S rRNA processing
MSTAPPFLGIDFGTSKSTMAWLNPRTGQAEIIKNAEGEEKTPSVVYFGADGALVGTPAENMLEEEEQRGRVVVSVKRSIARSMRIALSGGGLITPLEVVVEILKKLKRDAEKGHFKETVERVVLTCPAAFSEAERDALVDAATRSGFHTVELLEEPVAAALAYAQAGLKVEGHVLVYDLGGGTFDLAVLARDATGFRSALAPKGLRACGGDDFDRALYDHCDELARQILQRSLSGNDTIDLQFLRLCRLRKESLTERDRCEFSTYLPGGVRFKHAVERSTFEGLISRHLEETVRLTRSVVDEARDSGHAVATVVLIGGSSRVPLVQRLLLQDAHLPVEPQRWQQQDVAVALGAAYHGQSVWGANAKIEVGNIRDHSQSAQAADSSAPRQPNVRASNQDDPADSGRALRQRVLEVVASIEERARELELPDPPEEFQRARERLASDSYQVLVLGEVKRGKSTLVNALLGCDLLPTDVGVATSQVFRITHAERQAYQVRFEDGTGLAVQAADLPLYGSQVVAGTDQAPRLDQIIRWIEVETPFTFLPRGVALLDTPGVGGLNAAHGEITNRFIQHADAVLFVLDSERPIGHAELTFLRSILGRTHNILFVQTKIDKRRREEWEEILKRNEEIVRRHVGQELADCRVWPISSKLLRQAAKSTANADILRIQSRHEGFEKALSAFLYRVVGWSRSVDSAIVARAYCDAGERTLASRQAALEDESQRQRQEYDARLRERQERYQTGGQEFNRLWSEMSEELDDVSHSAQRQLHEALGRIEDDLRERIDGVSTVEEGRSVAQELADEALRRASDAWQDVQDAGSNCYGELLSRFLANVAGEGLPEGLHDAGPRHSLGGAPSFAGGFSGRVSEARSHALGGALGAGVPVGVMVAAGVLSAPVAAIGIAAAAIWGMVRGWKEGARQEALAARSQLQAHFKRVMQSVRTHYVRAGESLFQQLERSLRERTRTVAEKAKGDAEEERARLARDLASSEQQRQEAITKLKQGRENWLKLGERISAIQSDLAADQQRMSALNPT